GYQLYTSTAITPVGVPPVTVTTTAEPAPLGGGAEQKVEVLAGGNAAVETPTADLEIALDDRADADAPVEEGEADMAVMAPAPEAPPLGEVAKPVMRTLAQPGGAQPQMSAGVQPLTE